MPHQLNYWFIPTLLSSNFLKCSQWHSHKLLIGEADFGIVMLWSCDDCSIRVTALLGYLDLAIPVFLLSGDARTLTDVWKSVSFTNFKCSMHPTGPMVAF